MPAAVSQEPVLKGLIELEIDELDETVIEPSSSWQMLDLSEFARHRELFSFLVWRDLKVRFKQTVIGVAWAVIKPTMLMVVMCIVFSDLSDQTVGATPRPLFFFIGLLLWTMFETALGAASASVVGSAPLLTKIYFPRLLLPPASLGPALSDFVLGFAVLAPLLAWYGVHPTWAILLTPLPVIVATLAALSIGTLFAALNVAYRDVGVVVPFLMRVWMFATPAIYVETAQTAPKSSILLRSLIVVNPVNAAVEFFRSAMLGKPLPWYELGVAGAIAGGCCVVAYLLFRRLEDSFADVI